jgi:hypothetical protein
MPASEGMRLLLRLEARRLSDAFRNPRVDAWAGVALPVVLAAGGLWLAGAGARPDVSSGDGVILLGLLAAAPVSLQAYPILFRPADDGFLRRLGISARALFGIRALRLFVLALAIVLALMIPFVSTGQPLARPVAIAFTAAVAAWAVSLWAQARAAVRTSGGGRSLVANLLGPDPELVAAGALVYAPLFPLVAGAAAARFVGAEVWTMPLRMLIVLALSLVVVPVAAAAFARALPRFAPHAGELAYAPPPDASGGELVVGRGVARVLPRRAQAVRARDAVVLGRRYRWAGRAAWPVAVVGALAVIRAGGSPAVRAWVTLACGLMLLAQAGAVVALGRSERGRTRGMDRALGIGLADRVVGRWAAALGLALGLALPLAAGWGIGVDAGGGWIWIAAAAGVAAVASLASLTAAGR